MTGTWRRPDSHDGRPARSRQRVSREDRRRRADRRRQIAPSGRGASRSGNTHRRQLLALRKLGLSAHGQTRSATGPERHSGACPREGSMCRSSRCGRLGLSAVVGSKPAAERELRRQCVPSGAIAAAMRDFPVIRQPANAIAASGWRRWQPQQPGYCAAAQITGAVVQSFARLGNLIAPFAESPKCSPRPYWPSVVREVRILACHTAGATFWRRSRTERSSFQIATSAASMSTK